MKKQKTYSVDMENKQVICLKCDQAIKLFGYAVGNKYGEGECQSCGQWIARVPMEFFKE